MRWGGGGGGGSTHRVVLIVLCIHYNLIDAFPKLFVNGYLLSSVGKGMNLGFIMASRDDEDDTIFKEN